MKSEAMLVCSEWHLTPRSQQSQALRQPHSPQLPAFLTSLSPTTLCLQAYSWHRMLDLKYLQAYYSPRVACILLCEGERWGGGAGGKGLFLKMRVFWERNLSMQVARMYQDEVYLQPSTLTSVEKHTWHLNIFILCPKRPGWRSHEGFRQKLIWKSGL